MVSGGFGTLSEELKHMAKTGLDSDNEGIKTVDLVLNAFNLERGIVKYDMQKLDFNYGTRLFREPSIQLKLKD